MGEKVTDFTPTFCSESGQNFKNRGHLYNKHPKFINRGLNSDLCPYIVYKINLSITRISNRTITNTITLRIKNPSTRLYEFVFLSVFIFGDFLMVVHCKPTCDHIGHRGRCFVYDICFRSAGFSACLAINLTSVPNNVLIIALCALVEQVVTRKGDKSEGIAFRHEHFCCAFIICHYLIICVIENTAKLPLGFENHSVFSEFKCMAVKLRTAHLRIFAHQVLVHWLRFALFVARSRFTDSLFIAFGRGAVDVVCYIDLLQNLNDVVKGIFASLNLKDEIASVGSPISVYPFLLALVAKCNQATFLREMEMIGFVILDFTKKPCGTIYTAAAGSLDLPRCWIKDLGIYIRHSDSNIKSILFVTTFIAVNVVKKILNDEVVCSLVVYHKLKCKKIPCKSHKGGVGLNAGYILTLSKVLYRYPSISPSLYSALKTIAPQMYNEFPKHARNVNFVLTFRKQQNLRKIAAKKNITINNSLNFRTLKEYTKWNICQWNIIGDFYCLPP